MAATITIEEVKSLGVSGPDFVIQGLIDTADSADACIDGLNLSDDQEKALKAYFVAWQLDTADTGNITSQRSATGASQTYANGVGVKNRYESAFKAMAGSQCILAKLSTDGSVFLDVVVANYD
jgi:hypothetical protein